MHGLYNCIIICLSARYIYGSVFVCLCRLLQLHAQGYEVQVRVSLGFYSHVFILILDLQNNALFSSYALFVYLENAIATFQKSA